MLLALDTSTATVSVAILDETEDVVLAERHGADGSLAPMKHGELLAPAIAGCLEDAGIDRHDLTAIVVGVGPGPYTGLRVGVVTARTLGLALQIPVYGICSLDALAAEAGGPCVVTTDARRKEVFWASYDESGRRLDGPEVDRPADLAARLGDGDRVVGAGPVLYPDVLVDSRGPRAPRAAYLARLLAAEAADPYDPEPIYLRRPDAVAPAAPKPVS